MKPTQQQMEEKNKHLTIEVMKAHLPAALTNKENALNWFFIAGQKAALEEEMFGKPHEHAKTAVILTCHLVAEAELASNEEMSDSFRKGAEEIKLWLQKPTEEQQ